MLARLVVAVVFATSCIVVALASEGTYTYNAEAHWGGECERGEKQSPVNIMLGRCDYSTQYSKRDLKLKIGHMGTSEGYKTFFTGHNLQIDFKSFVTTPEIKIPPNPYTTGQESPETTDMYELHPIQMHLHTPSEHTINGMHYPAELHIVTEVKRAESEYCDTHGGCLAVFAVMLRYNTDITEGSGSIWSMFKRVEEIKDEGKENGIEFFERLDLDRFIPESKAYYTYLGSLTTPPCSEKVTWFVFQDPLYISTPLVEKHHALVSYTPGADCVYRTRNVCTPPREKTNNRFVQRLHGRRIEYYNA